MKRILCILTALLLLLSAVACAGAGESTTDSATAADTETETGTEAETSGAASAEGTTAAKTEDTTGDPTVPAEGMRAGGTVRVMSYNLDADTTTAGTRAPGMLSIIRACDPDSIGVQEARSVWVTQFRRELREYSRVGVSADGANPAGDPFGTYIYYKTDKYNVIDSGTFWLSRTPDEPSKYSEDVDCNRTCCWAILEDKQTGFRYVHLNSHLDWMDEKATAYQMEMIRKQIVVFEDMGLPVFATGDYNTDEGSAVYQLMLKQESIGDAKAEAAETMSMGTYPHYGDNDVTTQKPIDFCFVTRKLMTVNRYRVVDDKYEGNYVSDHFGLLVEATVGALPDRFADAAAPAKGRAPVVTEVDETFMTVEYYAASGFSPISHYLITVLDSDGNVLKEARQESGFRAPEPPRRFTYRAAGLEPAKNYTVRIIAVNLYGKQSEPVEVTGQTAEPVIPAVMPAADIFDLVLGDTWQDSSPAGLELTAIRTPELSVWDNKPALYFHGNNGNLKAPGIRDYYGTLRNGFTMELDVLLTQVGTYTNLMSNMHAGGFGFEQHSDGMLGFSLHCNGQYEVVSFLAEANVRYHLVASYDGNVLSLYANGKCVDSLTVGAISSFATEPGAQYLCIGADSDATGIGEYPAEAYIFHARIYSHAATAGQAKWLFEQSR